MNYIIHDVMSKTNGSDALKARALMKQLQEIHTRFGNAILPKDDSFSDRFVVVVYNEKCNTDLIVNGLPVRKKTFPMIDTLFQGTNSDRQGSSNNCIQEQNCMQIRAKARKCEFAQSRGYWMVSTLRKRFAWILFLASKVFFQRSRGSRGYSCEY